MNKTSACLAVALNATLIIFAAAGCARFESSPPPVPSADSADMERSQLEGQPIEKDAPDLTGKYAATGTNPDGTAYTADLEIVKRGETFEFAWLSGQNIYKGIAVANAEAVAVVFTGPNDAPDCGAVVYKINADGSLDGKATYWGSNKAEDERAVPASGELLNGNYDVTGTNAAGKRYTGKLRITKRGDTYAFLWNSGRPINGFGMRFGNSVAAGLGPGQCSMVGYEIRSDGTLVGRWADPGQKNIGTETAKRR